MGSGVSSPAKFWHLILCLYTSFNTYFVTKFILLLVAFIVFFKIENMRTAKCLACNVKNIKTCLYWHILLSCCTLQFEANMLSTTIYFSVRVMDLGILQTFCQIRWLKNAFDSIIYTKFAIAIQYFLTGFHEAIRPVVHSCMSFVGSCLKCNG